MANEINSNGIVTDSYSTTYDGLVANFKDIYGQDINLEQSTPDGQLIGIAAQAKTDTAELSVRLYNMFNPDTVQDRQQDNLYSLVGLKRKATKFSFVEVQVTTTGACTLQGLDNNAEDLNGVGYTVSDTVGNNWVLLTTQYINSAGTYTFEFRAQNQGAVEVLPNTITNMVTVVGNVASVNNAAIQYITGQAEETNAEFRNRFYKSRALGSTGTKAGLLSKLLNANLVKSAYVHSNSTGSTDASGTPEHTVWVIVEGGADADIANIMYANITDGCGMRGSVTYSIATDGGLTQTIKFDRPTSANIYLTFSLLNKSGAAVDQSDLKDYIVANLQTGVYSSVDTLQITNIIQGYRDDLIPYDMTVSTDGINQEEYIIPSNYNIKFTLPTANIAITSITNI